MIFECACVYLRHIFIFLFIQYVWVGTIQSVARAPRDYLEKRSNYKVVADDGCSGEYESTAALRFYFRRRLRQSPLLLPSSATVYTHILLFELHYITIFHHRRVYTLQIASSHSDKLNNSP